MTVTRWMALLAIGASLLAMFSVQAFGERGEREMCVARAPDFGVSRSGGDGDRPGYELLDFAGREVWGTRDWTPEAYDAFSLPPSWMLWRKNDPRLLWADGGRFLRSPGCEEDGLFSYMKAFDRDFLQVVRLRGFNRLDGEIRQVTLEKYHVLTYDADRSMNILENPDGERFIGVSRSLDRIADTPTLPEGWTLMVRHLDEPLEVALVGKVRVLRMDNEDSYQGPIAAVR